MKMKYSVLLVLFFLSCCLVYDATARRSLRNNRGKNKQQKRKQKNKVIPGTTVASETTADSTSASPLNEDGDMKDLIDLILRGEGSADENQKKDDDGLQTVSDLNATQALVQVTTSTPEPTKAAKKKKKKTKPKNPQKLEAARQKKKRKCDPPFIEYRIFSLIAKRRLPFDDIFPTWTQKPTPSEKVAFLNQTLIANGLRPLPNCKTQLNLNLAPETLKYFLGPQTTKLTTPATTLPVSLESIDIFCGNDELKRKYFDYVSNDMSILAKVLRIRESNINREEKLQLINATLVEASLPPLPVCSVYLASQSSSTADSPSVTKAIEDQQSTRQSPQLATKAAVISTQQIEQQISNLIEAGFLPPEAMEEFRSGEIDATWIRSNVSQNREFILSRMPTKIRDLIVAGDMPEYIEDAIFSGEVNRTAINQMIFSDDEVVKMLLPEQLSDMLGDRPVPEKLKLIMMSGKNETEMAAAVKNDTELLEEIMSPSMFFFYSLFEVQRNRDINTAISVVLIVVLLCVMTSLGCTMTISKIGEHARKPKGVLIALLAQFVIMPAAAFGLTRAFNLDAFSSMAVLICGCCPGGNLSNMLAYALSGDMNLSILMTTCSSIIGLGMMPLNIFIYSRFIVTVDSGQIVPFDKIVFNIALTIIPVAFGIVIRHFKPQWVPIVMRCGAITLAAGTVLVAVLSGVMLGDAFFIYFPLPVLACCAILPLGGYMFGYIFAWVARENPKCRRTICVETGCQNVQLCSTVLKLAFNPVLVGVLFLMPLVYMCFQLVEAVLMIGGFRIYTRCFGKKEVVDEDSEEKKKSDVESSDDEKKDSEKNDTKSLLNTEQQTPANGTSAKPDGSEKPEAWPLDGKPTEAYLDSFKTAGTEHLL